MKMTTFLLRAAGAAAVAGFLAVCGCSSANPDAVSVNSSGHHPTGWVADHYRWFFLDRSQCTICHGPDLRGGISNVSCFSSSFEGANCHAGGPAGHPTEFADPALHGPAAKGAPAGAAQVTVKGFISCQQCHGSDFSGGVVNRSCYTCHGVSAPHPPKPWRGGTFTHVDTDPLNAPVCEQCHRGGRNLSSISPPAPQPSSVAAGCFNNTLCHGQTGHPPGWVSDAPPQPHGNAAKGPDNGSTGFESCRGCHGQTFQGGVGGNPPSCFGCHGVNAPHPPKPWRGSDYMHTNTDQSNAPVCDLCHHNGANSDLTPNPVAPAGTAPGCFNGTLCHNENVASHPVPWLSHPTGGNPPVMTVPTDCVTCHGANLQGGSGPACTICHYDLTKLADRNCTSCHSAPPSGSSFPNVAGAHSTHLGLPTPGITCTTCHNGFGSGSQAHYDGSRNKNVHPANVALVSTFNAKSGAASYDSSSFTCTNVSCHGGKTTPAWQAGSIDVNSNCTACHSAGTTQYNSYNSGRHGDHAGRPCTACHNVTTLAVNHFNHLNTTVMEGPASATIGGGSTSVRSYNANGTCTPTCHGQENWFSGGG